MTIFHLETLLLIINLAKLTVHYNKYERQVMVTSLQYILDTLQQIVDTVVSR